MPRLTITLPEELRVGRGESRTDSSRRLGSGIEGCDRTTQRVVRWVRCWAGKEET
jgi:hypothetical protein